MLQILDIVELTLIHVEKLVEETTELKERMSLIDQTRNDCAAGFSKIELKIESKYKKSKDLSNCIIALMQQDRELNLRKHLSIQAQNEEIMDAIKELKARDAPLLAFLKTVKGNEDALQLNQVLQRENAKLMNSNQTIKAELETAHKNIKALLVFSIFLTSVPSSRKAQFREASQFGRYFQERNPKARSLQ